MRKPAGGARLRASEPARPVPSAFAHEWVKPGITGRVKFLRGEHTLRHATRDFEEGT
ncbi:hypothetical protein [Mesorhizobium sp.]|uniref:hypothetical protein n=1 Tax=Mesorhizobium sp. TaxID=1871066 RepID=UPI0025BE7124|nr:hypothetical protein [Mesorhizobium sp.]